MESFAEFLADGATSTAPSSDEEDEDESEEDEEDGIAALLEDRRLALGGISWN